MKTHIFIVGQLRFKDEVHLLNFKKNIENHEIYICTYEKYKDIAKKLTTNLILIPNNHKEPALNINQWYMLDRLIDEYSHEFDPDDVIYRIRTDLEFTSDIFLENNSNEVLKLETDYMFSSKAFLFKSLFSEFYKKTKSEYFFPEGTSDALRLNYDNLIISKNRKSIADSAFRWEWFNYPEEIITKKPMNFELLSANIKKFLKNPNSIHMLNNKNRKPIVPWVGKLIKKRQFASEVIMIYHCLKKCPVSNYNQKVKLMEERKLWI